MISEWIFFNIFLVAAIIFDLNLAKRKSVSTLRAGLTSALWIILALLFNLFIYKSRGSEQALQFFTGYLIELTLSFDNLALFLLIFSYFQVSEKNQHTILFWGILGALFLRLLFIIAGTLFIQKFHWLLYFFGLFLIVMGVLALKKKKDVDFENSLITRLLKRFFSFDESYSGDKFFIKKEGKLYATKLFFILIFIEVTDLLFALDSIPAIFGVTLDPFLVYTSNAFAILGLRSFYLALRPLMNYFSYLHHGIAVVLILVGTKMILEFFFLLPTTILLAGIIIILVSSMLFSIFKKYD